MNLKLKRWLIYFILALSFIGAGSVYYEYSLDLREKQAFAVLNDMKMLLKIIRRHCVHFPTSSEGFEAIKDPDAFYGLRCKDFPRYELERYADNIEGKKLIYISDGKKFVLRTSNGLEVHSDL